MNDGVRSHVREIVIRQRPAQNVGADLMAETALSSSASPAKGHRAGRLRFIFPIAAFAALMLTFGWALNRDPSTIPSALIGQLRIVYKELPILGPNSVFAAKAALAADKQGKYVAFHRALFQLRGPIDEGKVLEAAAAMGLDIDRMKTDMKDAAVDGALEKTGKLAQALQITGTPGFVVGDQFTTGATDLTTLQGLIAKARSGQQGAQ